MAKAISQKALVSKAYESLQADKAALKEARAEFLKKHKMLFSNLSELGEDDPEGLLFLLQDKLEQNLYEALVGRILEAIHMDALKNFGGTVRKKMIAQLVKSDERLVVGQIRGEVCGICRTHARKIEKAQKAFEQAKRRAQKAHRRGGACHSRS